MRDNYLYEELALIDASREGRAREREIAATERRRRLALHFDSLYLFKDCVGETAATLLDEAVIRIAGSRFPNLLEVHPICAETWLTFGFSS